MQARTIELFNKYLHKQSQKWLLRDPIEITCTASNDLYLRVWFYLCVGNKQLRHLRKHLGKRHAPQVEALAFRSVGRDHKGCNEIYRVNSRINDAHAVNLPWRKDLQEHLGLQSVDQVLLLDR